MSIMKGRKEVGSLEEAMKYGWKDAKEDGNKDVWT